MRCSAVSRPRTPRTASCPTLQDHLLPLVRRQRRASGRQQHLCRRGDLAVLRLAAGQDQPARQHLRGPVAARRCVRSARSHPRRQDQYPVHHEHFAASGVPGGACHTKFIDETPELFDFEEGQDRATKVLRYIAEIQSPTPRLSARSMTRRGSRPMRARPRSARVSSSCSTREGPEAVKRYVLDSKRLLITDTTCANAHQSLLATRMRTRDMVGAAKARRRS